MEEQKDIGQGLRARGLRGELLRYVDRVYAFAEAVTLDEGRAARLTAEAYRRAFEDISAGASPDDLKSWLFDWVLTVRREQQAHAEPYAGLPGAGEVEDDAGLEDHAASLPRRWAEQVVSRLLPVVMTGMPEDLRTVLVLCDVEGVSCAQAGQMLDMSAEAACVLLDVARERLIAAIRQAATAAECTLLDEALSPEEIRSGLQRMLQSELPPVPPAVRMGVEQVGRPEAVRTELRDREVSLHQRRGPKRWTLLADTPALRGAMIALLLIIGTGIAGLLVSRLVDEEPEVNLITLMARGAEGAEAALQTNSAERAEQFVEDEFGLRLTLPEIDQAELQGVGVSELARGVEVPVFLFTDSVTGRPLVLYAYTYAMLDRYRDRVTLEADILNQIADDEHFDLHDLGAEKALIWRNRDDIFVAITSGDAEALRERIFFPS